MYLNLGKGMFVKVRQTEHHEADGESGIQACSHCKLGLRLTETCCHT